MRTPRIKPELEEPAVYHCTCRTVFGTRLSAVDCQRARDAMWPMAGFNGIEILTYSFLRGEFHILLRVAPAGPLTDEELVRRKAILYGENAAKVLERDLAGSDEAAAIRAGLQCRMNDLSFFLKELKMRITIGYNQRHQRFGTLWAERFSSLLIENRKEPLLLVANFIDLGPVRQGLCRDPRDYPFSGFGEAVAGGKEARAGIEKLVGKRGWQTAAREYRAALLGKGRTPSGPKREEAERCLRTGVAFGSPQFIEKVRDRFPFIAGHLRPGKRAEWPEEDIALQFARRQRKPGRSLKPPPEIEKR